MSNYPVWVEFPEKEPMWENHLLWLLDNEPELVRQMFQNHRKALRELLDSKATQAAGVLFNLQQKGIPRPQAEEIVLHEVIAPPDGPANSPDPPEPLPENLRIKIMNWARKIQMSNV